MGLKFLTINWRGKMLNKLKKSLLVFVVLLLLAANCFCLAQEETSDGIDVELTTGGQANCVFNGRVPFRRIKAANNNLVVDTGTGLTEVSINSELDTEKNVINVDLHAVIEALSNPAALLDGEDVEFESRKFDFSISKQNKISGTTVEISNETPEGEKTTVTGKVVVNNFVNNEATGVIRMVFANTFRTIEKLDEEIETDENGNVTIKCNFKNVPVNFTGDILDLPVNF